MLEMVESLILQGSLKMKFKKKPFSLIFLLVSLLFGFSCVPIPMEEMEEKTDVVFNDFRQQFGSQGDGLEGTRDIRFGDRYYIENVILEIFGPSVRSSYGDQIYELVFKQQGTFGGACDYYAINYEEWSNSSGYRNPNKRNGCFQTDRSNSPIAKSNTVRAGYIIKLCEHIVDRNKAARDFAYNRAGINPSEDELSNQKVYDLYKLFYPIGRMPAGMKDVISEVNNTTELKTSGEKVEDWNSMLLAFCVSPGWQIP